MSKVRAKSKTTAPRIEPVIEKIEVSARATERLERERQVPMFEPPQSNELPALSLLDNPPPKEGGYSPEALEAMSRLVEIKLTISASRPRSSPCIQGPSSRGSS